MNYLDDTWHSVTCMIGDEEFAGTFCIDQSDLITVRFRDHEATTQAGPSGASMASVLLAELVRGTQIQ
jgi:hypothetical protein